MVTCPLCDAVLDVEEDELDEGDELTCEECAGSIIVKSKDPLEMKSGDEEEDEEDDFEDFEEDEEDEDADEDEEEEEEEEENW